MRKIFLFIGVCTLAVFISSACGAADMYLSFKTGLTMPQDSDVDFKGGGEVTAEFDPGYFLSGAVGGWINDRMRIEALEVSYQENDFDKDAMEGGQAVYGEVSRLAFTTNFYYDFINSSKFTPYLGTGMGLAKIEANVTSGKDSDTVFAYHFTGGLALELGPNVTIDLSYRYSGTNEASLDIAKVPFNSHNLYAGCRLSF